MLLISGVVIVLFIGFVLKILARLKLFDRLTYDRRRLRITWKEYGIGAAVCCVLVVPLVVVVGNKVALGNNLTYREFWSGYETAATRTDTTCTRDGSCHYTYRCDPYTVTEVVTVPNADGKGTHTEVRTRTEYHSCPEATVEWNFKIATTLGDFDIERTFTDDPQPWRGSSVRGDVRRGTPPFWQEAADRLQAGDPRGVTVRKSYDNYILASQSTILKQFSDDLERYRDVLPAPATKIHDHYLADKVYPVGVKLATGWNEGVTRFNAAFGSELQGDLHLVIVGTKVDPDGFTGALNAHWTSKTFGKDAISKNALVVVIGTDGEKVTWARAFTGMPRGNEALLLDVQRELKNRELDPSTVLGRPVGIVKDGKLTGVKHVGMRDGTLESQVWGTHKFQRVCMTCEQEGGGGFTYLGGEIQPTGGQRLVILLAAALLSLIVWATFIIVGTNREDT